MIDYNLPKDWKSLQEKVAEIFREIGYSDVEADKKLKLVRGTVNADVYAVDNTQSPVTIYICECKLWSSRVPKTVVHSFRTVMQDFGAHQGIIISKKGFQKGALEAAENTNISLKNWFGFQDLFEDKWWPAICLNLYKRFDDLINYADVTPLEFRTKKWKQIENDKVKCKKFAKLLQKYRGIGYTIMGLGTEAQMPFSSEKPTFPMAFEIPTSSNKKIRTITLNSLREYTDCLISYGQQALDEFAELFP